MPFAGYTKEGREDVDVDLEYFSTPRDSSRPFFAPFTEIEIREAAKKISLSRIYLMGAINELKKTDPINHDKYKRLVSTRLVSLQLQYGPDIIDSGDFEIYLLEKYGQMPLERMTDFSAEEMAELNKGQNLKLMEKFLLPEADHINNLERLRSRYKNLFLYRSEMNSYDESIFKTHLWEWVKEGKISLKLADSKTIADMLINTSLTDTDKTSFLNKYFKEKYGESYQSEFYRLTNLDQKLFSLNMRRMEIIDIMFDDAQEAKEFLFKKYKTPQEYQLKNMLTPYELHIIYDLNVDLTPPRDLTSY